MTPVPANMLPPSGPLRRAFTRLPVLLPTLVAVALTLVPGLGTLDYHACLALAPLVGLCAGHLALRISRPTEWVALLLGPLAVLCLAALWVPNCNLAYGLRFYVLGPLGSALVGAAWGRLAHRLPLRKCWQVLAFYAIVLASLVRPALHFYHHPQVFAFHGLVGWLAGALYEDAVTVRWSYVAFRLVEVALWGPLLVLPLDPRRWRQDRRVSALLGLALTAAVVGEQRAGPEHWRVTTDQVIADALPIGLDVAAEKGVPALRLHLASARKFQPFLMLAAEDAAFRAFQLRQWFGVAPPGPLGLFLYPDADSKRTWMGAERVDMAKPWLRQVHMVMPEYGASVLTHELAHVYASAFGPQPFGVPLRHGVLPDAVLIEGVAVAAEWPVRAGLDPHQWARAMRQLGLAPDLRELLSPVGFFGQSSDRAYTLAGSWLRWLAETRGMAVVRRLYATADVQAATGQPFDTLAKDWGSFVDDPRLHPLTADDLERAKARFERPGLFQQPCALEVGRCGDRAVRWWRTGQDAQAETTWRSLVAHVQAASGGPPDPELQLAWAVSMQRIGRGDAALQMLEGLLALPEASTATVGPALNRLQRAQVWIELGDLLAQQGRVADARAAWLRAARLPIVEAMLRTLEVKRALTATPAGVRAVQRLLAAGAPPGPSEPVIDALHLELPDDAVATYLWARLHFLRDPQSGAVQALAHLQLTDLPWTRREVERLLALDDARHGRCEDVATRAALWQPIAWWRAEFLERCAWRRRGLSGHEADGAR